PPFNVNIWGHGYTGNFATVLGFAANMAQHGFATIGIDAVNHGLVLDSVQTLEAGALLASACAGPFLDGITVSRARDLDGDGLGASGGDFWTSYLFHTRDSVRQSVLDQIQLVRILRSFGSKEPMLCRTAATGWNQSATTACDVNADGKPEVMGDFNGDGV